MKLQQGDIFVTRNPMWLGRAITAAERFWATDNQARYSHAGIVLTPAGDTFESLWTIRQAHIDAYKGHHVLIGRATSPTACDQYKAIGQVRSDHEGGVYPAWRLLFHLFPPLAKYISSGRFPVCSELVVKKEILSGVSAWGTRWQGYNPDAVADAIRKWDAYDVVAELIWPGIAKFS
jgi:hypothetical protein